MTRPGLARMLLDLHQRRDRRRLRIKLLDIFLIALATGWVVAIILAGAGV